MWQPLFKEPDESLEREDEWSEPKGFLFGGWADYSNAEIAQQYFDAAHVLVEAIDRNQWADYKLAYPVLSLYRHYLELMLKAVVGSHVKTHDIKQFVGQLEILIQERHGHCLPIWVKTWLTEISDRDPTATMFRYGVRFDKMTQTDVRYEREEHVDLRNLQEAMRIIHSGLHRMLSESDRGYHR
jgi:hypothetical protein